MYTVEKYIVEDLKQKFNSPYAACMFAAKKARGLATQTEYMLGYAEALSWAITDIEPHDLESRLELHREQLAREQGKITTKLENLLELVDDAEVSKAVKDSYAASVDSNKLVFIYNTLVNDGDQARVRILTKMAFYERPVQEKTSRYMRPSF